MQLTMISLKILIGDFNELSTFIAYINNHFWEMYWIEFAGWEC